MVNNIECIGIVVVCKTCGWKSETYDYSENGGKECAMASAVIETRLGHVLETARRVNGKIVQHEVNLIDVFKED